MDFKRKVQKLALGFRKGILGKKPPDLMCFAVCAPLQGYLSAAGIEAELVEGHINSSPDVGNHYWLRLADGTIVDPTADQFPMPDGRPMPQVYVGKLPEWYQPFRR